MMMKHLSVFLLVACINLSAMADTKQDIEDMEKAVKQKDYAASYSLARKLAEAGNAEGQFGLSVHYMDGLAVTKDEELFYYWLRKAAQQGHEDAIFFLGSAYRSGKAGAPKHPGYEQDVWIRKMANQGDLAAQRHIEEQKQEGIMTRLFPGYRSRWHDPNYAVEKD